MGSSRTEAPRSRDYQIRNIARVACLILVVGISTAYVLAGVSQPWDFETYHFAASAYRSGLNPYSTEALSAVSGKHVDLPFLYPPATLGLFLPSTALPVHTAAMLWLGLKAVLLLGLMVLWHRDFLEGTSVLVLVGVVLLGFDLAVLWDLRTGNVALVEAALLWVGLAAYTRGAYRVTACLIGLASVFKLTPALLLGVLAMSPVPPRRRLPLILLGLAFPAVAILIPPGLSAEWLAGVGRSVGDAPPTYVNPSSLALAGAIVRALELPSAAVPATTLVVYLLYCAAVLVLSLGMLLQSRTTLERALFVVLLWLLLSPRLMIYSYIMAIAPALYVIENRIHGHAARWVAIAIVVAEGVIRLMPGQPPAWIAPAPLLVLWGVWWVWLHGRIDADRTRTATVA